MQLGCTIVFYDAPLPQVLEWVRDAGGAVVDIPSDVNRFPPDQVRQAFESVDRAPRLGELTGVWGPHLDLLSPDAAMRQLAQDYMDTSIVQAAEIGADLTHICFMTSPENLAGPRPKLEEMAADALRHALGLAEEVGITLLVEPLFQRDVSLINTADQAVRLWSLATGIDEGTVIEGGAGAGLLLDIFHMHHEEVDLLGTLDRMKKIIRHVHIADHDRDIVFGDNSAFAKEAIQRLNQNGYQGAVTLESIPVRHDPSRDLGQVFTTMRSWISG
jgi:sugar phosphate isomerase/epimerase